MKDLLRPIIFVICLLGVTAVVFFLKYGQQRAQTKMLVAENEAVQNQAEQVEKSAIEMAKAAEVRSVAAQKKAEENLKKAAEARSMLERAKSQSAASQRETLEKLNAQLEREADARIAAESASKELQIQRDNLLNAVAENRKAFAKMQKSGATESEMGKLRKLLAAREAEIEKLKERQKKLEEITQAALKAQIATEREITQIGGAVKLPLHKRLSSAKPNTER